MTEPIAVNEMDCDYVLTAISAVVEGVFIPAHDKTFDITQVIGEQLNAFREYITEIRDIDQANAAIYELLAALWSQADTYYFREEN